MDEEKNENTQPKNEDEDKDEDEDEDEVIPEYTFCGKKNEYKLREKFHLAKEISNCKKKYDDYYKNPEKIFDKKTKTWKIVHLKEGYLSKVEGAINNFLSFKATLYTWKCYSKSKQFKSISLHISYALCQQSYLETQNFINCPP